MSSWLATSSLSLGGVERRTRLARGDRRGTCAHVYVCLSVADVQMSLWQTVSANFISFKTSFISDICTNGTLYVVQSAVDSDNLR